MSFHIETPLRKHAIVESVMAMGGKSKFKVPDMPDVVIRLEKELRSHAASVRSFTEIIESNTVIAGELLSIIKSPLYQKRMREEADEITTVHHVVKFLGLKKTFELTMSAAIRCMPQHSDLFRSIIDHSADVAVACAEIATHVHNISMEEAFLFGLFRNGGAIGMSIVLEDRYIAPWHKTLSMPITGLIEEYKTFGARHDYLGVIAARQWGFGETHDEQDIIIAIQEHHNHEEVMHFKNERVRLLVAIGMLAENIVNGINGEVFASEEANSIKNIALEVLCLPDEAVSEIRSNSLSKLIFS
jgi:HD-like signal output (HDOD) protein